jgi:hypothetical protein
LREFIVNTVVEVITNSAEVDAPNVYEANVDRSSAHYWLSADELEGLSELVVK